MSDEPKKPRAGQAIAFHKRKEMTLVQLQQKCLELWLVKKMSYRGIGEMFGISYQTVGNYVEAAWEKANADLKRDVAVNVRKEFGEQLKFAKRVRDAAEKWLLIDEEISLDPRSTEVMVIYDDLNDRNQKGEPKQKREKLSVLLEMATADGVSPNYAVIKTADIRKLALDAINTTDTCIDKFAKLGGDYVKDKTNPKDIGDTADAIIQRLMERGWDENKAREWVIQNPEVTQIPGTH